MGANLYIEKIHRPLLRQYGPLFEATVRLRDSLPPKSREFKTAQKEVVRYYDLMYSEGYFRDPDNVTNVLNRLGLSWWNDVIPLCTDDRKLQPEKARQFRDMVASARLKLPSKSDIVKEGGTVESKGDNSLAEWHRHFTEKHATLLKFLDKAIRTQSSIQSLSEKAIWSNG